MILRFESTPSYVQGKGILYQTGKFLRGIGRKFGIVADATVEKLVREPLTQSLAEEGLVNHFIHFEGECHRGEVKRVAEAAQGMDAIIGAGGGRTLDAAKLVGRELSIPVVTCPTLASTDAPGSRVAVLNHPDGSVDEIVLLSKSPVLVLVDTQIIGQAPLRFLVAGMGDALSTWFEARSCYNAGGRTLFGTSPTSAGLALAHQCWENLSRWGTQAIAEVKRGQPAEALEVIVETNILLSGLGFENGGLALAHALHNGLSQLQCTQGSLHGEKVAFGLLVQCIAEEASETEEVLSLLQEIGLPTTLEALGCHSNKDSLKTVVDYVFSRETAKIRNEPIKISPQQLLNAILKADSMGHERGRKRGDQNGT